jgi:hypothetical protein
MTAYTLDGVDLGNITEENIDKETYLTPMPGYMIDSAQAYIFDFGGCIRSITIDGVKTGTLSALQTFVQAIEALVNAHQDVTSGYPKSYVNDLSGTGGAQGTIKVKVKNFTYRYTQGVPGEIRYTLKLLESGTDI